MGDRVRVIVVDDEPDLREMVAAYLGKYGFVVDAVADGGVISTLIWRATRRTC